MQYRVIMRGTGEEILARADEWRHLEHLQLVENRPENDITDSQFTEGHIAPIPEKTEKDEEIE